MERNIQYLPLNKTWQITAVEPDMRNGEIYRRESIIMKIET